MTTFPGFPIGLPKLTPDAPPLSDAEREWVDGLPQHQRGEATWTLRAINAAFERVKR